MTDFNPYQAPSSTDASVAAQVVHSASPGVWRDGNLLVLAQGASLPRRCVKSNLAASGPALKRRLSWHHPAIFISILAGLLIYVVLALVLSKKATVEIWLSDRWKSIRRRRIMTAWTVALLGVAMFVLGMAFMDGSASWHAMMLVIGFLVAIAAAIYGLLVHRMVAPKRISDSHVWIKGVHPDYLNSLPPVPVTQGKR